MMQRRSHDQQPDSTARDFFQDRVRATGIDARPARADKAMKHGREALWSREARARSVGSRSRDSDPRPTMKTRPVANKARRTVLVLAMLALGQVFAPTAWTPSAQAQLFDLMAIRAAAADIAARSRTLAERAGADYQPRVLEEVRRSCAARSVTRLDEIAPAVVATEASDAAAQALLTIDFSSKAPPAADTVRVEAVDKATVVELGADGLTLRDGQVRTSTAFEIARDHIGTIEIDVSTGVAGHLLLGWSEASDAPRLRRNNARIELVADGRVHTYAVDAAATLARGLSSGASVRRFFLANRAEGPVEIRAFRVLSRAHRYAGQAFGTSHEARGGELRSVLYARPPTALTFDVNVPATSPVLETGLAIVGGGGAAGDGVVEFEVAVHDGAESNVLLKRLVKAAPWEDVALDLGAWAGKSVRVSLAVRGSRDAIALWSSPLVRPRLGADRSEPMLVLLEDAMRADRLSVYGGPVATPAHERIAQSGVAFERAFAQATQTRSSVPSMMTSLMPSATGTWDFSDSLSDRYVTLAEVLRTCGYSTASFLQNGNAGPYAGLAQGFDTIFVEESFGPRAADLLGAESALSKWIARQDGRPWFAYVHVLDPHGPYDPLDRPDLAAATAGDELQRDRSIDAEWLAKPTAEARRLLYDAEVAANDRALAGFLDRLDARGDLARATIAVVADHGEFLGEHGGLWRHHPPGHVEVARVPFLLRAPGAQPRRVARNVALLDLMPTLLELARIDAASLTMHGTSLAGTLQAKDAPERAIVADEMILDEGERRPRGCGSFATAGSLWLLSCTRDEDFSPGRLLASRSGGPAPLRRMALDPARFGEELPADSVGQSILEGMSRRALITMQADNVKAWQRMTDAAAGRIVSEPLTDERLRALGYLE